MSSVKGLPVVIVVPFTPTIVFSATQGTVTYTTQTGSIRYLGAEYANSSASLGTWLALISATVTFTFSGSAGNVSVAGIPLGLPTPTVALTPRSAPLSSAVGIDPPTNSQGAPSSQITYPATAPLSAEIIYYSNTGSSINVNAASLTGTVTIGVTQIVSSITPPY